jgi:hypothetical protein
MTVILGLVPGISIPDSASEAEMAGTRPAMTVEMIHFTGHGRMPPSGGC